MVPKTRFSFPDPASSFNSYPKTPPLERSGAGLDTHARDRLEALVAGTIDSDWGQYWNGWRKSAGPPDDRTGMESMQSRPFCPSDDLEVFEVQVASGPVPTRIVSGRPLNRP
jgi:hypothetical protein